MDLCLSEEKMKIRRIAEEFDFLGWPIKCRDPRSLTGMKAVLHNPSTKPLALIVAKVRLFAKPRMHNP